VRICGSSLVWAALAAGVAASLACASAARAAGTITFTITLGPATHAFFAGTPWEVDAVVGTATTKMTIAASGGTYGITDSSFKQRTYLYPKDAPAVCATDSTATVEDSYDIPYAITIGSETHVVTQRMDVEYHCASHSLATGQVAGDWAWGRGTTATFTVGGIPLQVTPQPTPSGVFGLEPYTRSPEWSGSAPDWVLFTVGNAPPRADAGPDQTVTIEDPVTYRVSTTLDGSASSDPNGDALTYTWTGAFLGGTATGVAPVVTWDHVLGDATVTLTVSDGTLTSTDSVVIHIRLDKTGPVVSGPSSVVVEATGPAGARVDYPLTAADPSGAYLAHCDPDSPGMILSIGTHVETCVFGDGFGNATTVTLTAIVQDTTPPLLRTTPGDRTVEATGPDGAAVAFSTPTATDVVDGSPPVTCSPASGSSFPLGTTTVTCSATDAHGNTVRTQFQVTVHDTTPPTLSGVPGDTTVEATDWYGALVSLPLPAASDAVDPAPTVSCDPDFSGEGYDFPLGDNVVTCTTQDASGNVASASFHVTVVDTTPPEIGDAPADVAVEATSPDGAAVGFAPPSAYDLVDFFPAVACSPGPGSTFPLGTTTVTCIATDYSGNTSAPVSFHVTVQDTIPPALAAPAPVAAEATGPNGAAVSFELPAASDAADPSPAVSCDPAPGATFPLGTTTVTCTARDASGNVAAPVSFTVVVHDTTPPDLLLPGDLILEAAGPLGAPAVYAATATDAVDGSVAVVCTPTPPLFPLGKTTVDCFATDAAGNTARASFAVTVRDTTPPALTLPADLVVEAPGPAGTTVTYAASATDLVDGPVQATCTPASGTALPVGRTTVDCTASDAAGNVTRGSFSVEVRNTPPTLKLPADFAIEATSPAGAIATYTATATDPTDGAVPVSCTPASGTWLPLGTTTVACSATDAGGNTVTGSFAITVRDTTPPKVNAALVRVSRGGSDESTQTFLVAFLARDAVGVTSVTATLNGIPVREGQLVRLKPKRSGAQKVTRDDGELRIEASSFTLEVRAADAAGNVGSDTAVPTFPLPRGHGHDDDR
jgi:hypothetical protein